MFDDLINSDPKKKHLGIECPICKEKKVVEYEPTMSDGGYQYRNFECEECKSKFSLRTLGI